MPPAPAAQSDDASAAGVDQALLLAACRRVLAPLARLAVERGVPYPLIDELVRSTFVDAARAAHPDLAAPRGASRVSAATGLTRREVARLSQPAPPAEAPRRSPAASSPNRRSRLSTARTPAGHGISSSMMWRYSTAAS